VGKERKGKERVRNREGNGGLGNMDGLEGVRRDGKEEEVVGREGLQTSKIVGA